MTGVPNPAVIGRATVKELPDRWRELGEFIREQRAGARLSLRRLSDMAGISNPYLSQIERGLRKPSAEILQQIAKALRISAETLYIRAGILEERDGEHDLVAEILRDPALTEDQKQTLVRVYLSFSHENQGRQAVADAAEKAAAEEPAVGEAAAVVVEADSPATATSV